MAQAEKRTIKAKTNGHRWKNGVIYVLFQCLATQYRFTVEGMVVKPSRRGRQWRHYNQMYAGRIFEISLNAGGVGIHYAEGIRWDDSIENWVQVPKPILMDELAGCFSPCKKKRIYQAVKRVNISWDFKNFAWSTTSFVDLRPFNLYSLDTVPRKFGCLSCAVSSKVCDHNHMRLPE